MTTKTLTIEHPEAHQATAAELDEAAKAEGVPEGYAVTHAVNESGARTKFTLYWDDAAPADAKAAKDAK